MRAQQFDASRHFVVVGDSQVNADKAERRSAGGLGQKHILDREWGTIENVGIVQIGDCGQSECRLQQAAKAPHKAQLDHLVEKSHILNGVLGVVVQRDCVPELLRGLRTAAITVVFNGPAIGCRHGTVLLRFPVRRLNEQKGALHSVDRQ